MSQLPTRNSEANVSLENLAQNNSSNGKQHARSERSVDEKTEDDAANKSDKHKILELYSKLANPNTKRAVKMIALEWIDNTDFSFTELLDIIEMKDDLKEFLDVLLKGDYYKSEDDEDEENDDQDDEDDEDDEDDDIDDENDVADENDDDENEEDVD